MASGNFVTSAFLFKEQFFDKELTKTIENAINGKTYAFWKYLDLFCMSKHHEAKDVTNKPYHINVRSVHITYFSTFSKPVTCTVGVHQ
jgi:hypothetical protein